MPTNGHAETPVSINGVYSLWVITVSCNPKMSRFQGQQFIIKVNWSMEIKIALLVLISGKVSLAELLLHQPMGLPHTGFFCRTFHYLNDYLNTFFDEYYGRRYRVLNITVSF
jgi:hypothetical protein